MTDQAVIDWDSPDVAGHWDDPEWRRVLAKALSERIWKAFRSTPLLTGGAGIEDVGFTDKLYIRGTLGKKVFYIQKGGAARSRWASEDVVEVPNEPIGFHFTLPEGGLLEDSSLIIDLVERGRAALAAEFNVRCLSLLESLDPSAISAKGVDARALRKGRFGLGPILMKEYTEGEGWVWHVVGRCEFHAAVVLKEA